MTQENILKLHEHFSKLAKGDFSKTDFNADYGKGGSMTMGELTPEKRALIISDAISNKEEIERKFPDLFKKEPKPKPKEKKEDK